MPHPAANTKIENLAEAFESLALACAESVQVGGGHAAFKNVAAAREGVTDALREFLQPTLRVVE